MKYMTNRQLKTFNRFSHVSIPTSNSSAKRNNFHMTYTRVRDMDGSDERDRSSA